MIHKKIYLFYMISLFLLPIAIHGQQEPTSTQETQAEPHPMDINLTDVGSAARFGAAGAVVGAIAQKAMGGSLRQVSRSSITTAGLFAALRTGIPLLFKTYIYSFVKGKKWIEENVPSLSMGYVGFAVGAGIGLPIGAIGSLIARYGMDNNSHKNQLLGFLIPLGFCAGFGGTVAEFAYLIHEMALFFTEEAQQAIKAASK